MLKIFKTKKASIPVVVFVVLVIALFVFTLLAFYFSSREHLSEMEKGYKAVQEAVLGYDEDKFVEGKGSVQKIEKTKTSGIFIRKEKLVLQITYPAG